ncbi:MAG: hypothetical protein PVF66_08855 [Candidatus Aminicenantes bacterium]|jgi:hypothetical protein
MKKSPLLFCIFLTLLVFGSSLHAKAPVESEGEPESKYVFRLPYMEKGFYLRLYVPLEGSEVVFKKEPDFGDHKVIRGSIPAAREEKEFLCFAWDVSELKLYLDLNRNLDLTDDPSGVFQGQGKKYQQSFHNVRFKSVDSQVPLLYHVTVSFSDYRIYGIPLRCVVYVRSGWKGDIVLYGKKWQLRVVDNLDGIIGPDDIMTLRPYEEGQEEPVSFSSYDRLDLPQRIFFDGHDYDLGFGFEPGTGGSQLVATFKESPSLLGTLEMSSSHIRRLILREGKDRDSSLVLLDLPGNRVLVPARVYSRQRIFLDGGEIFRILFAGSRNEISVIQDEVTPLKLGVPLTHTVEMKRHGTELMLDYQLLGVGGEKYVNYGRDFKNRPAFAIYRGKKQIASGSFEYG